MWPKSLYPTNKGLLGTTCDLNQSRRVCLRTYRD